MRTLTTLTLLLLFLIGPALAENRTIPVKFAAGATGTQLVEGVARGETATFVLNAGAGQKMRVSLTAVESNAVFDVIGPNGNSLGASTDKAGQQVWYGALPQSGAYKVIVSTTRGGAEVTIDFSIR